MSKSDEEKLPIIVIWEFIKNHKKVVIAGVVIVIAVMCGYYGFRQYQQKKEAEKIFEHSISHFVDIIGTYSNTNVKLELHADNTAILTTNVGRYNEARHLGHWEEKTEYYPISIDFSDSFRASMCGEYDGYFIRVYFWDNSLWPSLDAIQSRDYQKAENLTKNNKKK